MRTVRGFAEDPALREGGSTRGSVVQRLAPIFDERVEAMRARRIEASDR